MNTIKTMLSEMSEALRMEQKINKITHEIHVAYYSRFPDDKRAIDRTRDDYPLFLLKGIINKRRWE